MNMNFYDNLENHYDRMTRFQSRFPREKDVLINWVERYNFKSVLDVGCGTGIHSIVFALLGLDVTGTDMSDIMLHQARKHCEENNVKVSFVKSTMEELDGNLQGNYEAIFCLGNTFPHLLDEMSMNIALENFFNLLIPEGILVIQLLNYAKIYAAQNRIVGIHQDGNTEYIRFYDFHPELRFNILIINREGGAMSHRLESTGLYPYRKEELNSALGKIGFEHFEYYGNMEFLPFDENKSSDLIIVAKKGGSRT